jgi:hypothetical protein
LNGGIDGGDRNIKIGMVERRWVKTTGWIDNPRYKNGIGLLKMLGLAVGVVQHAQTAHAMWAFQDNDPEFGEMLNEARKIRDLPTGHLVEGLRPAEHRALFIKNKLNPFLQSRFGESAVLDLANELAFRHFLTEDLQ